MNSMVTPLYEQEALQKVTGATIRPGGLNLTERAIAFCALSRQARIIDVACGTGASVEWLTQKNGYQVMGVDASELMLKTGRTRCPSLPLACGISRSLPIASGQFEAVLVECSLSLMSDLERVLQEFYRVLLPSGYFIASDLYLRNPQAAGLLRSLPAECCLKGAMSLAELSELLGSQGFEIMVWEDHSKSLKHLITQLLLAHGSMPEFWCKSMPRDVDLFELQVAIARARPGYYLLVARKTMTAYEAA